MGGARPESRRMRPQFAPLNPLPQRQNGSPAVRRDREQGEKSRLRLVQASLIELNRHRLASIRFDSPDLASTSSRFAAVSLPVLDIKPKAIGISWLLAIRKFKVPSRYFHFFKRGLTGRDEPE